MRTLHLSVPVLILFISCSAGGTSTTKSDKYSNLPCVFPAEFELVVKDNPVKRSESEDAYKVELKGLVEVNEKGDVYIVTDPDSRSRRTYLVTGELTRNVAALNGKTVVVKCCFLEKRTWSGIIRVYEIKK